MPNTPVADCYARGSATFAAPPARLSADPTTERAKSLPASRHSSPESLTTFFTAPPIRRSDAAAAALIRTILQASMITELPPFVELVDDDASQRSESTRLFASGEHAGEDFTALPEDDATDRAAALVENH